MDFDVRDLDGMKRTVITRVARHTGDLFNQFNRGIVALAKDGIAAAQMLTMGNVLGDEELRAIGVGTGVGVGQTPRAIEGKSGRRLVLELIAGIALAGASWISALNHEVGNHAMEN